jgi:hypothetical protein
MLLAAKSSEAFGLLDSDAALDIDLRRRLVWERLGTAGCIASA